MTIADLALGTFTLCNVARVFAYFPQLMRIARDTEGAKAISCATWALFTISHLSTIWYAVAVTSDTVMAFVFGANAAGCAGIIALTRLKRRTTSSSERET